ncbi:hypothetical protein LDENG_00164420, partial [Lucifuga dentata]
HSEDPFLIRNFDLCFYFVLNIFSNFRSCVNSAAMKNLLKFAVLCLFLCSMFPVGSMKIYFNFTLPDATNPIPLDLVEAAVDDMYLGCTKEMKTAVEKKYKKEIQQFEKVWKKAEKCTNRNLANKLSVDKALTKDHMQAICVYTSDLNKFYQKFNEVVQTGREQYCTSFPYHTVHFLLTTAIQLLKENQQRCHTVYRRTKKKFTGNVGQIIRFGYFASTSLRTDLTHFGKETCFNVTTCSGAFLKKYAYLQEKEKEVLIPPYEMFQITKIIKGPNNKSHTELSDCKVVYLLKSAGDLSNLNCKAAKTYTSSSRIKT